MGDKPSSRAIKDFLAEAEEIIEKLNFDLVSLGDRSSSGDADPETVNAIFRGAHSLKGISGMFGFADISELSHQMENLLDRLRLGKLGFSSTLVETLFRSLEVLTGLVTGKGKDEHFTLDTTPILAEIEGLLEGRVETATNPLRSLGLAPEILNVLTEYEEHRLLDTLKKGRNLFRVLVSFKLDSFDQDLADLTETLKKQGEVISTLPSPGDSIENIAFQLIFGTDKPAAEVSEVLDLDSVQLEQLSGGGGLPGPEPVDEKFAEQPEKSFSSESITGEGIDEGSTTLRSFSRTVRVDIEKLDNLMNIVGELVLSKGAISRLSEDMKQHLRSDLASELHKATRILERRLEELQAAVMEVRMVPVSQLFEKMVRIVRRVANEHRKLVSLDIRGGDTELDKLIVEDLADPLMHIIRNVIDHGIESPAERLAAGKPEKGMICLWASQKGNHVVIEVHDDGRGIDLQRVQSKAIQKGLVPKDAELTREEIFDILFLPGFSTREQVSDLSGRGVGMDVVKNNIAALSGMIEIDSELGQGTSMAVTLPITLAIIKALIVRACGKTYAIPINSVLETLMIEERIIETIERREVIELRQTTLPLLRLEEVFQLSSRPREDHRSFVAVVGMAEKRLGIVVDELLGQQDVVIKSLGNALSFVRGIAGAADLGNQQTILVLDVGGLMNEALRGETAVHV